MATVFSSIFHRLWAHKRSAAGTTPGSASKSRIHSLPPGWCLTASRSHPCGVFRWDSHQDILLGELLEGAPQDSQQAFGFEAYGHHHTVIPPRETSRAMVTNGYELLAIDGQLVGAPSVEVTGHLAEVVGNGKVPGAFILFPPVFGYKNTAPLGTAVSISRR